MKISFTGHDGIQDSPFTFDLDPSRLRGARTAFGAELYVSGDFEAGSARPLAMSGVLSWETENGYGLQIPMQPVGGGTATVAVPISDRQLASLEERRAGGEARLQIAQQRVCCRFECTRCRYRCRRRRAGFSPDWDAPRGCFFAGQSHRFGAPWYDSGACRAAPRTGRSGIRSPEAARGRSSAAHAAGPLAFLIAGL